MPTHEIKRELFEIDMIFDSLQKSYDFYHHTNRNTTTIDDLIKTK